MSQEWDIRMFPLQILCIILEPQCDPAAGPRRTSYTANDNQPLIDALPPSSPMGGSSRAGHVERADCAHKPTPQPSAVGHLGGRQ